MHAGGRARGRLLSGQDRNGTISALHHAWPDIHACIQGAHCEAQVDDDMSAAGLCGR
jgi:hypothetical protein